MTELGLPAPGSGGVDVLRDRDGAVRGGDPCVRGYRKEGLALDRVAAATGTDPDIHPLAPLY